MTKQHFEWAARYVRACIADNSPGAVGVEEAFTQLFRTFGPRFDAARFRAACHQGVPTVS